MIEKICYSWAYFLFVIFIIIPIDIAMIINGKISLGICLIIAQVPWYLLFLIKKIKGE